jgi:hypothetical protein
MWLKKIMRGYNSFIDEAKIERRKLREEYDEVRSACGLGTQQPTSLSRTRLLLKRNWANYSIGIENFTSPYPARINTYLNCEASGSPTSAPLLVKL